MKHLVSTRATLANIDVAVLCGGLATRLKGIIPDNLPKCLVDIHGKPCLELVLDHLVRYGANRVVLCTGHLSETVEAWAAGYGRCELVMSRSEPLGVLHAMKLAREHFARRIHLFVNGDTITNADFGNFLWRYRLRSASPQAFGILMARTVGEPKPKQLAYLLRPGTFARLPKQSKHFHRSTDKLDHLKNQFVQPEASFIDIGTPEGLQQARMYLKVA